MEPALARTLFSGPAAVIRHGTSDYDDFLLFVKKYFAFLEVQSERAMLAAVATGHRTDDAIAAEEQRVRDLNFTVPLERPVTLDGALSRSEWAHLTRLVQLYVDYRVKKPFQALRALHDSRQQLPIAHFEDDIIAALRSNQVIIVSGDTGCGKSTQVPQFLLNAGFSKIACTQPRRLSAMALCRRVAFETMNAYGSQVAYQIRFDSTRTLRTRILFLTEGVLLRLMAGDPLLTQFDVIIVDEVHERHLSTDFLLAVFQVRTCGRRVRVLNHGGCDCPPRLRRVDIAASVSAWRCAHCRHVLPAQAAAVNHRC